MRYPIAYLCMLLLSCSACDRFESHPYSVKIKGRSNINTSTINQLQSAELTYPITFAFITDTQGSLDETGIAIEHIKSRPEIQFVIHGGDITDFGLPKEFIWGRDQLESLNIPFLSVIGNHDCLANGEDTFDYIFGPENFSFNIANTHFLCLNTVALEYDYSKPVPDFGFITSDLTALTALNSESPHRITRTIVVMHSRPYDEQFNNNVALPFNHYLEMYPGLNPDAPQGITGFCINGHNHYTDQTDIFHNGVIYYQCANMAKRQYMVFTLNQDGYEYEIVNF